MTESKKKSCSNDNQSLLLGDWPNLE